MPNCFTHLFLLTEYSSIFLIYCRLIHQTNHDLHGPILISISTYGATPSLPTIKTVLFFPRSLLSKFSYWALLALSYHSVCVELIAQPWRHTTPPLQAVPALKQLLTVHPMWHALLCSCKLFMQPNNLSYFSIDLQYVHHGFSAHSVIRFFRSMNARIVNFLFSFIYSHNCLTIKIWSEQLLSI